MNLFFTSFCCGISLLLSFLLFFHPLQQNSNANKWLSAFVFIMCLSFISNYLRLSGLQLNAGYILKMLYSLQFLLSPCLYISVLFFTSPQKKYKFIDGVHFLPFIVYTLLEYAMAGLNESLIKTKLFSIFNHSDFLIEDLLIVQGIVYSVLGLKRILNHQKKIQLFASSVAGIDLNWLKHFIYILIIALIAWINDALIFIPYLTSTTTLIYAIALFFMAYFSIKQKTVFNFSKNELADIEAIVQPDVENNLTQKKSKENRLSNQQLVELKDKLNKLMEEEKFFLDNELNLTKLAQKLQVSTHDASFLINEFTGTNFYTYINNFRVDEAKRLLSSSKIEELNILGIAFSAGFNSKTTFNTTFKKVTGLSPTDFVKKQQIS
jgi:AraC-like DNA-binding protein